MSRSLDEVFERFAQRHKVDKVIARTLLNTIPELEADGLDTAKISNEILDEVFEGLSGGKYAKEAIPEILRYCIEHNATPSDALEALDLGKASVEEIHRFLEALVAEKKAFIKERGLSAVGPLMGIAMAELRGKVDGKTLSHLLKEKIRKAIEED